MSVTQSLNLENDGEFTPPRGSSRGAGETLAPVAERAVPPGGKPPSRPRRWLRALLVGAGLLVVVGGLGSVKAAQIGMLMDFGAQMAKSGPPPEAVSTAVAERQTWEATLSAVASVVSAKGVALSNDAPGTVSRIHFESGATVKQGQILVELDTRVERAQLASTRARRDLALTSLGRSKALVMSGAVAQSEVDANDASYKSLSADAAALEAEIGRKIVRAPFAGKVGIREVNLGQYLAPGTRIAVLESTESVYVDFTLPQRHLGSLQLGMAVRAFEEGSAKPLGEGLITAIEPAVDAATRTAKVRASLPGESDAVRPGMFLRVEVVLPEKSQVVAVPLTAVVRASYGDSVFVVEPKPGAGGKPGKVARQSFVKLGQVRGDFASVLEGLEVGQEVVTSGAFKLRNGLPLVVDNRVALKPELAPRPANQ